MPLETGMSVGAAFVLVGAAAAAFVAGGAMVCSALLLSWAQPLPLVVAFSTSSFVFVYVALAQLYRQSQAGYADVLLTQSASHVHGLSQLYAIMSVGVGALLLYTVDALIYRLGVLAANCYGQAALPQRQHHNDPPVPVDLAASAAYGANLHTSSTLHFEQYHSAELPDFSTTASPYERFAAPTTGLRVRGTLLSAMAVSLHHVPEGLALYVAAVRSLDIGVAVATAVVLHSLPDGIALASSIYFASGRRLRGVYWCLLAPVGKLTGAVVAWILLSPVSTEAALVRALAAGVAAGILLGVGVKEVMPTIHVYAEGKGHGALFGAVVGMFVLAAVRFVTL